MSHFQYCLLCGSQVTEVQFTVTAQKQLESIQSIPLLLNFHPATDLIEWDIYTPKAALCQACYKTTAQGHDLIMSLNEIQKQLHKISHEIRNIILKNISQVHGGSSSEDFSQDHNQAKLRQQLVNFVHHKYDSTINNDMTDNIAVSPCSQLFEVSMEDEDNEITVEPLPVTDLKSGVIVPVLSTTNNEDFISKDDNSIADFDLDTRNITEAYESSQVEWPDYPMTTRNGTFNLKPCTIGLVRCDEPAPKTARNMKAHTSNRKARLSNKGPLRSKERYTKGTQPRVKGKKRKFACAECTEVFSTLRHRRDHIAQTNHKRPRVHACPVTECTQRFYTTRPLELHIRNDHHGEFEHFCNFESCGRGFFTPIGLQLHQESNHASRPKFECDLCAAGFVSFGGLFNHKRAAHTETGPKFLCDQCSFGCKRKVRLEQHQAQEHNQFRERHKCTKCDFMSASLATLKKHISGHFEAGENPFLKYPCPYEGCSTRWGSPTCLGRHIQASHQTDRNFQCDRCPASFKTKLILNKHLRKHDGLENFTCPHCSKILIGKDKLKNHVRVLHEPEHAQSIKCEDCGAGFPIRKYYLRHRKICAQGYSGTGKRTTTKMIDARRRRPK